LQTLPKQTVVCGDPYYPNVTGTPTVSDTFDPNPSLTFADTGIYDVIYKSLIIKWE